MERVAESPAEYPAPKAAESLADLLERLGGISPQRVRANPPPGTATVADVISLLDHEDRLYELVDGTLVEKDMGFRESFLAIALGRILCNFVNPRNLGVVTGSDGTIQIFAGLVRMPDVAFVSWDRLPNRSVPVEPVPLLVPDLAVEVLSAGNTKKEMIRKRDEYFRAGVRLVWMVDLKLRSISVYGSQEHFTVLTDKQTLDGGVVLPGFSLPIADLFAELDRHGNPTP